MLLGTLSPSRNPAGPIANRAPAQLRVETLSGSAVATASVVKPSARFVLAKGGSYFARRPIRRHKIQPMAMVLVRPSRTYGAASPQRVILTDQPNASLVYCRDVTDINVMDDAFQEALSKVLGATICIPLSGDKTSPSLHLKKPIVRSLRPVAMMATKV